MFYWATVLATFAMGTAVGDLTARTLNLGYLTSGIWFSFAFAAVAVAHWKFRLNPILAFWIAYVLTRPVGASFADYVAFPHSVGGLAVGHGPVALALTVVIVVLVGYLAVTRKDVEDPRQAAAPAASAGRRHAGQQPGYPPASQPVPPRAGRPDLPPRYPRQYPEERYPGERYQDQRYAGQQYPEGRHPEQPHPTPPRSAAPREPWPPQQRPPSRRSRQPSEPWPDGDEAEHTAWGFFMWDE
jgi:hypothetical protein